MDRGRRDATELPSAADRGVSVEGWDLLRGKSFVRIYVHGPSRPANGVPWRKDRVVAESERARAGQGRRRIQLSPAKRKVPPRRMSCSDTSTWSKSKAFMASSRRIMPATIVGARSG
jgi:hypothetical protein